jgi:hypothetical protein
MLRTMRNLILSALVPALVLAGCQDSGLPAAPAAPTATSVATPAAPAYDEFAAYGPYDKPGFVTVIKEDRIWIFRDGSKELTEYRKFGELAKHVTVPGGGPNGMTAMAPDVATIRNYTYSLAKCGFVTLVSKDGRLWVFRPGCKDMGVFARTGELAKCVTLPGAGPHGITVKSPDRETALAYLAAKPGFVTVVRNDCVWVLKPGSREVDQFRSAGMLDKSITRPGAGPCGVTLGSTEGATLDAYLAAH